MVKSADAFRTISEVAEWLETPAHVLRFWESKFAQVKPVKRAGGRRYYRPADMELLGGIKRLLHDDGMTIKGVQKMLRDQGIAHVAALSPALEDMAAPLEAEIVPLRRPAPQPRPDSPASQSTVAAGDSAPKPVQEGLQVSGDANDIADDDFNDVADSSPPEETPEMSPTHMGTLPFALPEDPEDDAYDVPAGVLAMLASRRAPMPTDVAMEAWMLARKLTRTLG